MWQLVENPSALQIEDQVGAVPEAGGQLVAIMPPELLPPLELPLDPIPPRMPELLPPPELEPLELLLDPPTPMTLDPLELLLDPPKPTTLDPLELLLDPPIPVAPELLDSPPELEPAIPIGRPELLSSELPLLDPEPSPWPASSPKSPPSHGAT